MGDYRSAYSEKTVADFYGNLRERDKPMIRKAKCHNKSFQKAKIAFFTVWIGVLCAPVWGIGLGEIQLNTPLNEPLHAEIQLLQVRDLSENDLLINLAPKSDFEAAGVERLFFLTSLKFALDLDNPKGPMIIVTTEAPVREPYLNFLLEVQWPNGRLLREYTLLMDLPTFAESQSVAKPIQGTVTAKAVPIAESHLSNKASAAPLDMAALEAELLAVDETAEAPVAAAPVSSSAALESADKKMVQSITEEKVTPESESKTVSASLEEEPDEVANEVVLSDEPVEPAAQIDNSSATPAEEPAIVEEQPKAETQQSATSYDYAPAVPVYAENMGDYTTVQGDNLWNIAARHRQQSSECTSREYRCDDGITIQQTMIALQHANPQAFVNDNINQLKKGQILRMPSQDEVTDTTSREAIADVKRQNIAWSGDPDGRRDRAVAQEQLDATVADGSDAPVAENYEDGRLKLSVPGGAEGSLAGKGSGAEEGSVEALQNEMVIAMEELDRIKREKTGTTDKVNALNDQVKTLEKMLQVRSAELQALQASTEASLVANATATGETTEETSDDQALSQEQIDAAITAESSTEEVTAEAVEPPADVVIEEQGSEEPGLLDMLMANLLYIGIALLAVILALVAMVIVRKRAASNNVLELDDNEETMMDIGSAFDDGNELDNLDDVADSLEESLSMDGDLDFEDQVDAAPQEEAKPETNDAVSEADIYISFGSFDKAEGLLKSAIKSEPRRADLQLKLLEVYVGSDNLSGFDAQYETLNGLGDAGASERAREMRNRISGAASSPLDSNDLDLDFGDTVEETDSDLSLDFDLSLNDDSSSDSKDELDFDLDLSIDDVSIASESPTVSQPAINLNDATTVQQPALKLSDAPTVQQPALDFSDVPTAVSPAVKVASADTEMREELDLDLSELEGELDDLSLDSEATKAVANDQPTPSNTGLDEEFDFLADADEAATKLDLARAYIDMGDKEGAKDILQEVVEEGQEAQKDEARQLLATLG